MQLDKSVEKLLNYDRALVSGGLVVIIVLAWSYLLWMASQMNMTNAMSDMSGMGDMAGMNMSGMNDMMPEMLQIQAWTVGDAIFMFGMWATMMTAMMLPSATPVILLYALFVRKRMTSQPYVPTGAFLLGYLTVWIAFSAAATGLQGILTMLTLLSPMLVINSPLLGGILLIAAGIYQLLPTKQVCLHHCRTPVEFISKYWMPGAKGAFVMGLRHGAYCLGCCWILMMLLFVSGVMNLLWVAIIAVFVLLEKVAPFGQNVGRVGAIVLIVGGIGNIVLVLT
jgi:predicted metal-binding membrane protein